MGGNLCTFTPILGTQADATLSRDIILFIEEVNLPLVMGAPVMLDVTAAGASLTFGMEGRQTPVRTEDTVATPFQGGRRITEGKKQRRLVRLFDFQRHFEGIRR